MSLTKFVKDHSIGKIILFGLAVYAVAVFIVPLVVGNIDATWALVISFVPGLLICYYIVLHEQDTAFERKIYIGALILGFMIWFAIRSASYYSTPIEIIFSIGLFLLIYRGTKR